MSFTLLFPLAMAVLGLLIAYFLRKFLARKRAAQVEARRVAQQNDPLV